MRAALTATSAAVTAGAEAPARPRSTSAGSVPRSMRAGFAPPPPSAANCASAYSTRTRDLEVGEGLPESPTTAWCPGERTSLTSGKSAGRGVGASGATLAPDEATHPGRSAQLPQRPRARSREPGAARRRVVPRLERVRDVAAVLGGERDRGRVQRPPHAVRPARQSGPLGGKGGDDPVLHLSLWNVRDGARDLRAHPVRRHP